VRRTLFAAVVLACVVAGGTSVGLAVVRANSSSPPEGVRVVEEAAIAGDQILFRSAIPDETFGKLAVAPLSDPAATRALSDLTCDRVYFAGGSGLCLGAKGAFSAHYVARIFDAHFEVRATLEIPGIPSRARVSADGRLGALTTFVSGDSYAPGTFSTRTFVVDLRDGETLANLEDFQVTRDGKPFSNRNFNFWGVTFAGGDRFYATLGSGAQTYLVEGSLETRTMRVVYEHLECPSLSPDGTRVAFKRSDSHGGWRIEVLDLATKAATPLAETASVDDQVEWLDDDRVLYWRGTDVWVVPADGGGEPSRIVSNASSPVVVHS
jgi:hypothetical protein